ncbi:MAG TPA: hypothetical protein VHJ17_26280 [Thermomonospora sp.]|nr:hypothetical protein [Thermomonospora sp.]
MTVTTGRVLKVTWDTLPPDVRCCFWVGASMENATLMGFRIPGDAQLRETTYLRAILRTVVEAHTSGYEVSVETPEGSTEITGVTLLQHDISPVGHPVHDDPYTVTGDGIPPDARMVFESAALEVAVTPDLVRPHCACVTRLPSSVPVGRVTVRLEAPGWRSQSVPVEVSAGPPVPVRTLYPGAPKANPYTIAFVANPAIEAATGGTVTADPVLQDRPGFLGAVRYSLRNLFTEDEDLLRQGDLDRHIRLVALFDASRTPSLDNALAHEVPPNLMETRRDRVAPFLRYYRIAADYVSVLYSSTTHDRATAWSTSDDFEHGTADFTYDGVTRRHGLLTRVPGSAAIPISVSVGGEMTAFHEFGHAGSDGGAFVTDLYVDGTDVAINKKRRALATDPVPATFANYNGTDHAADAGRDSLGYPATWTSYHPELIVPTRPNLMDNYFLTTQPRACRFDRLTYAWYSDRLRAKVFR